MGYAEGNGEAQGQVNGLAALAASNGSGTPAGVSARGWLMWCLLLAMAGGVFAAPPRAADFDTVVAVPTRNGHTGPTLLPWLRSAPVGPDGRVDLALERRFDWVLLMVERRAPRRERVAGYVTYTPPAEVAGRHVRLRLSRATLNELARRDDGYRNAVNLYLNHDPRSGAWLLARPRQVWLGSALEAAVDRMPAPTDYRFAGFGVDVELSGASGLCQQGRAVGLYPPVPVAGAGGEYFGPSRPLTAGGDCRLQLPGGGVDALLPQLPEGWWTIMRPRTGEVLGEVAFSAQVPVTGSGHALVFVPLPRLVTLAGSQRVSHVAIDWVRYDVSQRRYRPAAPRVMSALIRESFVALSVQGRDQPVLAHVDSHAPEPIRAIGDQRLGPEPGVERPGKPGGVEAVTVGYEMQGRAYRFIWRAQR